MPSDTYERSRRMLADMNAQLERESEERRQKKGQSIGGMAAGAGKALGKEEESAGRKASLQRTTATTKLPNSEDSSVADDAARERARERGRSPVTREEAIRRTALDSGTPNMSSRDELENYALLRAGDRQATEGQLGFDRDFASQGPNGQGALEFENNFRADQKFRDLARQPGSPMQEEERQKILADIGRSAATVVQAQAAQAAPPPSAGFQVGLGQPALPPPGQAGPMGSPQPPAPDAPSQAAPGAPGQGGGVRPANPAELAAVEQFLTELRARSGASVQPNVQPVNTAALDVAVR